MAYYHGVKSREIATSVIPPVQTSAGFPVVVGTAPVHMTENPAYYVNRPTVLYTWDEAKEKFGYSSDWDKYTLAEVMFTQFQLYHVAPVCFINVLDPVKHATAVAESEVTMTNAEAVITDPVIKSTLVVKSVESGEVLTENTDYIAEYGDEGELILTTLTNASSLLVSYSKLDAGKVTTEDVLEALNLLDKVYTMLGIVPGILLAPGFSENPTIAASMKAHAININGIFSCIVLTDIPTDIVTKYDEVNTWKNANSYTGENQLVCWPNVRNGDYVMHMSNHILGIIGQMDARNDDIPYESPSNIAMSITGLCLKDGTEVLLDLNQANFLNSQGIIMALNFVGGWKSWGNWTACYPAVTDPKDAFISVKRMFFWQAQTFILTYWQKVDRPLTRRLVRNVCDSERIRLNGLTSRGFLLGASIDFRESENPLTDLLNGHFRVHVAMTPPVPAEVIEQVLEYDVNNFSRLFSDED